ncbi:hypothetical protein THAOC_08980 [Thalassiosira oceanica]|uniref:DUF6816 domain-containing protein n=1 Tax=Thalassiosira oceanica TaxID=159749 RepID=K0T8R9_THAOC|nr:hypothetical protein THAOC_08980 [Thalassiosira oceanica]|eukprot:EJK69731.1 hypothetical protein THAOC_08980 [Thalassiosira oceanica]
MGGIHRRGHFLLSAIASLGFLSATLQLNIVKINALSCFERRRFLETTAALSSISTSLVSPANAADSASLIADRLDSDIITTPSITAGSKNSGHENLYFPDWLEGDWDATQTLMSTKAPLGLKYIGGPSGDTEIARKTMDEQAKRIGEAVRLKLRFVSTKWGVVEDRAFNLRSRLDAFAGKQVVASVNYADVRESNRESVLKAGGAESDPLTTTLVYFKGPAAQKQFIISYGSNVLEEDEWAGYELQRSIFALTNNSIAPPVTTDTEAIYKFKRLTSDTVEGQLRLAAYLNPQNDKLFFETKSRAVSLTDYTLTLRRSS